MFKGIGKSTNKIISLSFIIPPDDLNFEPFKNQQLTALYLLTILEKTFGKRIDLSITDLRGVRKEYIKYYIPQSDIYCYTAFTQLYYGICEIRDIIRTLYSESIHIVGGPHIDIFCNNIEGFDVISLGDGDKNIINIINDMLKGELEHVYNNTTPVDLNEYPFPLRKYQPISTVVDTGFFYEDKMLRAANVLFSRGCPFRCHFCANLNKGPTRYRRPNLVEEEIEYLKNEYKVEALVLRDDNAIPLNRKIASPFLHAIARTGVKWRGQCRANGISEDMVELAARSGCLDLALGIESVSPVVLDIINKKIDIAEAKRFIKTVRKYKIGVKLLFIMGLPGETNDIVSRTIEFIDETEPNVVGLTLFVPLPGSVMTTKYKEFGIKSINENLHEYQFLFGRFDGNEKPRLMFEYENVTPWGKGMRTEEILENYNTLQNILRERNLIH